MYNIHCTLYIVHCTLYIVHCTLYSVQYTLYTIHCTVCKYRSKATQICLFRWIPSNYIISINCFTAVGWTALCKDLLFNYEHAHTNIHCIVYSVHCIVYSVHCIVYSVTDEGSIVSRYNEEWVHFIMSSTYTLYSVYIVPSIHCTVYTVYIVLRASIYEVISLYDVHCTGHHIIWGTLYSVHCTMYTVHCTVYRWLWM